MRSRVYVSGIVACFVGMVDMTRANSSIIAAFAYTIQHTTEFNSHRSSCNFALVNLFLEIHIILLFCFDILFRAHRSSFLGVT